MAIPNCFRCKLRATISGTKCPYIADCCSGNTSHFQFNKGLFTRGDKIRHMDDKKLADLIASTRPDMNQTGDLSKFILAWLQEKTELDVTDIWFIHNAKFDPSKAYQQFYAEESSGIQDAEKIDDEMDTFEKVVNDDSEENNKLQEASSDSQTFITDDSKSEAIDENEQGISDTSTDAPPMCQDSIEIITESTDNDNDSNKMNGDVTVQKNELDGGEKDAKKEEKSTVLSEDTIRQILGIYEEDIT